MGLSDLLVVLRLIVNLFAAWGCFMVAWHMHGQEGDYLRYLMPFLLGVGAYNAGAGIWFFLTVEGFISPHPLLWSHMYTLLNALETRGLKRGVAAICIGGGEGTAIAIERD